MTPTYAAQGNELYNTNWDRTLRDGDVESFFAALDDDELVDVADGVRLPLSEVLAKAAAQSLVTVRKVRPAGEVDNGHGAKPAAGGGAGAGAEARAGAGAGAEEVPRPPAPRGGSAQALRPAAVAAAAGAAPVRQSTMSSSAAASQNPMTARPIGTTTSVSSHSPPDPSARPVRILLVDDSAMTRKMTRRVLEVGKQSVSEAVDGVSGIDKVRAAMAAGAPFDLVLCDDHMPGMNGPGALAG